MKRIFLFTIGLLLIFSAEAQKSANRGLRQIQYSTIEQYTDLLDSMVEHWYFKKYNALNPEKEYLTNSEIIETSNEVIAERLKNVVSVFSLKYNDQVANWIRMYVHRNGRSPYLVGMTDYYFPIFEEVLDKYDMPTELKYIPIIESALNPEARSRAGAVGLWQFLYSTGKMYGLEVNSYVDQRMDPVKSTHAAALFLKDLYELYGDWSLVLAAYNCGPGNVNKAIRRSGKNDFWEIYEYLPRETRGYVPAYIAAVYLMEYYDAHNIVPKKPKLSLFTDTVGVNQKLHLRQVSEVLEIPYEELKALNPQYKRDILPGDKTYYLRLPFKRVGDFIDLENAIYAYKDSVYFDNKQVIVSPPSYSYSSSDSEYEPTTSVEGRTKLTYTIKSGDTYGFIAGLYNVSVKDLRHWNKFGSKRLRIGKKIAVWVPAGEEAKYKHIDSMSEHKRKKLMGASFKTHTKSTQKTSKKSSKPKDSRYVWHKIQKGENPWIIAQKYSGVTAKSIKQINGFSNRDIQRLQVGQYIKIKRK